MEAREAKITTWIERLRWWVGIRVMPPAARRIILRDFHRAVVLSEIESMFNNKTFYVGPELRESEIN